MLKEEHGINTLDQVMIQSLEQCEKDSIFELHTESLYDQALEESGTKQLPKHCCHGNREASRKMSGERDSRDDEIDGGIEN